MIPPTAMTATSPRKQPYPQGPPPGPALPGTGIRSPNPPYHQQPYKQPYVSPGYGYDFQSPGYYSPGEGWRQQPPPTLQKKPKELDKAMWVGNVLNDTTVAELQAVFEAPPAEAEGDIPHDIPESIFILSKSNCAFVNYSSHEAVDRAVLRFHDKEFKNTRLVCRPRKDPGADSYTSLKASNTGRFHHQQHHPGHLFMPEPAYYGDHLLDARTDRSEHSSLSEVQMRMDHMRLDGSPLPDSSSSGGEGPLTLAHLKYKDRANSKKSRSSSSLGYPDSRYFILKSLSEEDLKLSVQYGVWATQDHLVPVLNEAFNTTKDVYLIFSANKSGEFFGYARMMGMISKELEDEMDAANSDKIWQPAIDLPLSPELKASMLVAVEEAEKEGKQISTEEAEKIAIASTTTKSWGIKFPIQWIHVHKVPFSKTARMYNPYYENREVKVSKDGTELEPSVGQQLMALFQKSNKRRGRGSTSGTASQSNSEAGGDSRRSSIAGDHPNTLMPNQGRGGSSRRSSVLSIKSTGSGAGDRRGSHDPSQKQGSAPKSGFSSPRHSHRGQYGGDQSHYSGNRSNSRQNYSHAFNSQGATSPGSYPQDLYSDQGRGWGSKTNYRGGYASPIPGPPGPGPGPMDSPNQPRSLAHPPNYHHDQGTNRKAGQGGNPKYNQGQYQYSNNGHYAQGTLSPSTQQKRYPGTHHQGPFRSGPGPSGEEAAGGNGYKRGGPGAQAQGGYDYSPSQGPRPGGPPTGLSSPPRPPHAGPHPSHGAMYVGQGPPLGYSPHPQHAIPGYQMMPPYVGYPFAPGPNPYMQAMPWHPGPVPIGMIPGTQPIAGVPGAATDGVAIEGMIPLIGYDGVPYGYIHPEDAFRHQEKRQMKVQLKADMRIAMASMEKMRAPLTQDNQRQVSIIRLWTQQKRQVFLHMRMEKATRRPVRKTPSSQGKKPKTTVHESMP
ncbi:hypothetical protein BG005_006776 [Podila minutissima]|nr:hypothetical protein BG005_006776 [Podila minutissima]